VCVCVCVCSCIFFVLYHVIVCRPCSCTIFSTYPLNDTIFRKKLYEHKCVFCFCLQLLLETLLILRRIQHININVCRSLCKVPAYSCQILIWLELTWHIFFFNTQVWNSVTVCLAGADMFRAGRQADRQTGVMTKLMITFCSFMNIPKNEKGLLNLSALN
jgi:hypothetical protein